MLSYVNVGISLSWLTILLPYLSPPLTAASQATYTVTPQNETSASGKAASFRCAVKPATAVNFTVSGDQVDLILKCPGTSIYSAAESLKGYCEERSDETVAVWSISGTSMALNGTSFKCQGDGLPDKYGFLWVYVSDSYYGMLIGCVIGGFFGILIVFGMSYVFLQRSERFQKCFRGGDGEDDVATIVEGSKDFS